MFSSLMFVRIFRANELAIGIKTNAYQIDQDSSCGTNCVYRQCEIRDESASSGIMAFNGARSPHIVTSQASISLG